MRHYTLLSSEQKNAGQEGRRDRQESLGDRERAALRLDGTARDDHCRIRKGNADANFSILRRISLMLLKNEKTAKLGVKNNRLSAGWDEDYLLKVLVSI